MKDRWIQTYTGRKVSFSDPRPEQFCIEDIAHALSQVCRYAGNSRIFYSVAEHSVRVATRLPPELKLAGLLHDAAEAYLGDVPKPAKLLPELDGFNGLEERIMRCIEQRFHLNLGSLSCPAVNRADREVLSIEALILMDPVRRDWELPYNPSMLELLDMQHTGGWTPPEAESRMLAMFDVYSNPETT